MGRPVLTSLYGLVVRLTTRENVVKRALLAQSRLRQGQHVLDLGCGLGTLAKAAAQMHAGVRVVGLDGDPAILRLGRTAVGSAARVELLQGFSQSLPFPRHSFDVVLSSLFFHHLMPEKKAATLAEVHRILRPGGQLHIADWGAASGAFTRALFRPVQALDGRKNTADHVEGRIPQYLRDAGFQNVRVERTFLTMFGNLSLFSCRTAELRPDRP